MNEYGWPAKLSSLGCSLNGPSLAQRDLTGVTWKHAVNSQNRLWEALQDMTMMIEADIVLGYKLGQPGILRPIMAHPPDSESDLSLEEFLEEAFKAKKGIKLDFKSTAAFNASQPIIFKALQDNPFTETSLPMLFNADIIAGPLDYKEPNVDADTFLRIISTRYSKDIVLSLGWTTSTNRNSSEGCYSSQDIEQMINALSKNKIKSEITFAVRAWLAVQSITNLMTLVNGIPGSTLTVFSSDPQDKVNISLLAELLDVIGRNRILLDIDDHLKMNLTKAQRRHYK